MTKILKRTFVSQTVLYVTPRFRLQKDIQITEKRDSREKCQKVLAE